MEDEKGWALVTFLSHLSEKPMVVMRDSGVAYVLGIQVTQRVMSSAVNYALKERLVRRSRDNDARDFYDNPDVYRITLKGRIYLWFNK